MKESTKKLMVQVGKEHDWSEGQVYSHGGTHMTSTDTCRACGLRRHWTIDPQNGNDGEYRFSDSETGEDLTLRQAVARGCI